MIIDINQTSHQRQNLMELYHDGQISIRQLLEGMGFNYDEEVKRLEERRWGDGKISIKTVWTNI